MYKLKYLPLAQKDLRDITSYIADILKAPKAAMDLVDTLDNSIYRLQQFPHSCKVYQPIEPFEAEYRLLPVKNYLVFYIVTEHEVEIHTLHPRIYTPFSLQQNPAESSPYAGSVVSYSDCSISPSAGHHFSRFSRCAVESIP